MAARAGGSPRAWCIGAARRPPGSPAAPLHPATQDHDSGSRPHRHRCALPVYRRRRRRCDSRRLRGHARRAPAPLPALAAAADHAVAPPCTPAALQARPASLTTRARRRARPSSELSRGGGRCRREVGAARVRASAARAPAAAAAAPAVAEAQQQVSCAAGALRRVPAGRQALRKCVPCLPGGRRLVCGSPCLPRPGRPPPRSCRPPAISWPLPLCLRASPRSYPPAHPPYYSAPTAPSNRQGRGLRGGPAQLQPRHHHDGPGDR